MGRSHHPSPPLHPLQAYTLLPSDLLFPTDHTTEHHPSWYSQTTDLRSAKRGDHIHNTLIDSDLSFLNTDTPTRLPSHENQSSPVTRHHNSHSSHCHRLRVVHPHHSELRPPPHPTGERLLHGLPRTPHHTFTNFRKANWDAFTRETEEAFYNLEGLPSSCSTGEKVFREILAAASRKHIPRGHIPNLSDTAKSLIRQRDTLRSQSPTDPLISTLNEHLTQNIQITNKDAWINTVESCSHKYNTSQYFRLLKSLSNNTTTTPPNQPITFGHRTLTRSRDIAKAFCKQFTNIIPHSSEPNTRRVLKTRPLDAARTHFHPSYVTRAIRNSGNSRAAGPDGLTIIHLKHIGPLATHYLTHLYNLSYNHANIPSIWKSAIVIPIPKPGKPAGLGPNYRPISLLCPAVKVLERLLLPELNSLPLSPTQHGFRPTRSTTTALLPLTHQVVTGFNQPRPPLRTVAVSIDLSKAFDTISHNKLLTSLTDSSLHNNTVRWLSTYLRGRLVCCRYNNMLSPYRHLHVGVPQGSCISPTLFNFFVSTYPHSTHLTTSYADDFTDSSSHTDYTQAASALTEHATRVSEWAGDLGLSLSTPQSPQLHFSHLTDTSPTLTLQAS